MAGLLRKMSNTSIETVTSTADRIKLGLAVLVIIAGIVGFSVLSTQPMAARIGVFVGGLVLAALIAWFSEPGRRTISFGTESYNEVKRVSWPTRKETTQMTGIVFAFVAVMGIFMWVLDKGIEWIIYGLLLGWK
jgi:preprotein translocase subunit SecE